MSKDIIKKEQLAIFEEKKVKVHNIFINYAVGGEGIPIVFVHGWNNNWKGFIPLGKHLTNKFRVVLVDLPGFGDSDRLPHYTLDIQAKYLKDFIDEIKLQKPIVVGHSMGAYVVSKFYKLFPQKAKRIILIAPMFQRKNKQKLMKLTEWFYRAIRKTNLSKRLIKGLVDTKTYTYITAKYINMYKFDWQTVLNNGFEGKKKVSKEAYVDMGVEISRTFADKLIENNKIPIDMIFGKYDKLTNARHAKILMEGRGKYHFDEIDNSGHILTVEQPEMTAKAIVHLVS